MGAQSAPSTVDIFKRVYGKATDLLPEDYQLAKDIPFSEKQKVGEKYIEGVVLTNEVGITYAGSGYDAFELESPVAGSVKQAAVQPYITTLSSIVPWAVISRSAGAGDKAFFDATKFIVKNNLKSHGKFAEVSRIYGQSPGLLGYISYATATYRGVAFTNGTGTLNGIAFTNGVNTSAKYILLAPGEWASGIWVGMEGVTVQQVNASGVVVAEGKLLEVQPDYGYIGVDFTPVAASSATSHRLAFKGMADSKDMVGIHKIMTTTTGSLFEVPVASYSLWKGNVKDLGGVQLKLKGVQDAIAQAVNRGGLEGDVMGYVSPRTWANIVTTEAGARRFDYSYKPNEVEDGFESIVFHHQTGKTILKAHRMLKEGHAMLLHTEDWSRSGSAEISFSIPGMEKDIIYPLENQAGYKFTSFSDQYIFCNAPAKSIFITGINDESAS